MFAVTLARSRQDELGNDQSQTESGLNLWPIHAMQVESDLDEFQWISMFRLWISDTEAFKMFFDIMIYNLNLWTHFNPRT